MTDRQSTDPCPQCRNADAVHSIGELAAMAKDRLSQSPAGNPAAAQPGYPRPSRPSRVPAPSRARRPAAARLRGGTPAQLGRPAPAGLRRRARPGGHTPGQRPGVRRPGLGDILDPGRYARSISEGVADDIEGAIAGAALGAAARFIGRRVGRRVQQAYTERVAPAMAARQDAVLREQVAIAERHPDVRACLTDNVIFLAGGDRVLPMPRLDTLTAEQADALVAQLRGY